VDEIPDAYLYEFVPDAESSELTILLSSHARLHRYVSTERRNMLYLADPANLYFLKRIVQLADAINALVTRTGFSKTLFIGGSKAGFSATVLASLCAKRKRDHIFRVAAFSPHTLLYPHNERLDYFPSYRTAMKRAENSPGFKVFLERFGDLKMCENIANTFITVIYGEHYPLDRMEAERINGFNIRKMPVPFNFHSTLLPFIVKGQRPSIRLRTANTLYERMKQDPEARRTVPATAAQFYKKIEEVRWIPSMDELIEQIMAVNLER
jgi:hypothetical protein